MATGADPRDVRRVVDVEVADTVVDLVPEEPLTQDEVEESDIEDVFNHCAWCGHEVETESRRIVGLLMPVRQAFAFREGLTIPVPLSSEAPPQTVEAAPR